MFFVVGLGSGCPAIAVGSMEPEYSRHCQQLGRLELDSTIPLHSGLCRRAAQLARSAVSHERQLYSWDDDYNQVRCLHHWLVILSPSFLFFGILVYIFLKFCLCCCYRDKFASVSCFDLHVLNWKWWGVRGMIIYCLPRGPRALACRFYALPGNYLIFWVNDLEDRTLNNASITGVLPPEIGNITTLTTL
jgi:hypothetical protein